MLVNDPNANVRYLTGVETLIRDGIQLSPHPVPRWYIDTTVIQERHLSPINVVTCRYVTVKD